jgi:hypothetical protein
MRRHSSWRRATIRLAVLALKFQRYTQAPGTIVLVSPSRRCQICHKRKEVVVQPALHCISCWSKGVLSKWEVMTPEQFRKRAMG